MSKLTRVLQKIFASSPTGANQTSVIGSLAASAPAYTTNPLTMQSLTNFLQGLPSIVIGSNSPAIEDFNSLFYLFTYQLAYLMQEGIAEYDTTTTYFKGSQVNNGNGAIFTSLIDTNLNQALTDATKWKLSFSPATGPDVIVGDTIAYPYATHSTLAAAVADSNLGTNLRVLLIDSQTIASTISLTKAGWKITALPGVTYTAGAATTCISAAADGLDISNIRFAGFTVTAINFTIAGTYGRVWNNRFATSNTASLTSSAPAGKVPVVYGNIDET